MREHGGKVTFELQDSDVVCFRSAAADADGYHSLVQTAGASYEMPPLATVTLEKVEQPGGAAGGCTLARVRGELEQVEEPREEMRYLATRCSMWRERRGSTTIRDLAKWPSCNIYDTLANRDLGERISLARSRARGTRFFHAR